ncbi:MAG: deoxyhypusine synthase [Candidatus Caldarchaeum sp.]|jgi:deoxyhypusine synthase
MYVEDVKLVKGCSAAELLRMMGRMGGFMGAHLAEACQLLRDMLSERECLRMVSFTGNLVATGLRGVLVEMLRRKWFDLVFTTCGAVDHDIARTRSRYMVGSFDADDWELAEKNIHRLGNVYIDQSSYGLVVEREVADLVTMLGSGADLPVYEVLWRVGERLGSENSWLYWCYRHRVPVMVPGIFDGAFGYQMWLRGRSMGIRLQYERDQDLLNEMMWSSRRKAGLILGGGISKHHLLWWSQFGGEGLDTAVYISTADEYDGSLSGARPKEAITWHKISSKGRHVFVKTDATVALPLLVLALLEEFE